jgi:hypothetical protein
MSYKSNIVPLDSSTLETQYVLLPKNNKMKLIKSADKRIPECEVHSKELNAE